MFGAWQVGAWRVLADYLQPDLIAGASIGSVNGWAVAGGCSPAALNDYWRELSPSRLRLRFPRHVLQGCLEADELESTIRDLYGRYRPRIDYAVVLTDLFRLRPRVFHGSEVTAEHLLASCAVPIVLDQRRIGGRVYTDGGLLCAQPEWAAAELGAQRMISLNALPQLPSLPIRAANRAVRGLSRFRPRVPENVRVMRLAPEARLGSARDMIEWRRDSIRSWIEQGERDAARRLPEIKHFLEECFERQ